MTKLQNEIKEYSSKKLIEIIERQSNAYSEAFIDYTKDELIRRGETFAFDPLLEKQVKELKKIVETDTDDYHLEYLEMAVKEYISRGFKNDTEFVERKQEIVSNTGIKKRYPALRIHVGILYFSGIVCLVGGFAFLFISDNSNVMVKVAAIAFIFLGMSCLVGAEFVKVFIDIEENTRRTALSN